MSPDNLLRQAKMTGIDYLDAARHELQRNYDYPESFENVMRLAELMAKDFDTMMAYQSTESLCDALTRIADSLESIASKEE